MRPEIESFPTADAICRENGGGGNRTRERIPTETPSKQELPCPCMEDDGDDECLCHSSSGNSTRVRSDFTAEVEVAGVVHRIVQDGKHLNLHLFEREDSGGLWNFEPVETVIPKLRALLAAAILASGHVDPIT